MSCLKDTTGSHESQQRYYPVNYVAPPKGDKYPRGESHPLSKLTVNDVLEIRRRHGDGVPKSRLAADYGVSTVTIKSVIHGHTWGWVKDEPIQ